MALRAWEGVRRKWRLASLLSFTSALLSSALVDGSASAPSVRLGFPISMRYTKAAEGNGLDAEVTMCHIIDYEAYQRTPEDFPGYDELVKRYCSASDATTTALLSQAVQGREDGLGSSSAPTGLIFQSPRASCMDDRLLSGLLAASPANRVVAMPYVLTQAAQDCHGCSEADVAQVLKDLMWLMGAAPSSPKAADRSAPLLWLTLPWDLQDVVLRAFPSTPWLFTFSEPLWSLQHGSCLSSGGSEEECARELQVAYLSALAALRKSPGRALELRASVSTDPSASDSLIDGLLELLVPGHFHVALSDSEKAHMRSALTHILKIKCDTDRAGCCLDATRAATLQAVVERAFLPQSYAALLVGSRYTTAGEAAGDATRASESEEQLRREAWQKRQEAYVYNRTGSRFYEPPNCPDVPVMPKQYKIIDMINNWHPDDVELPPRHFNSLCRFDYVKEHDKCIAYRDAEVPFVMYNVPELDETTRKWQVPGYMADRLRGRKYHVEIANTSHTQYYHEHIAKRMPNFKRPTRPDDWSFDQWLEWAESTHDTRHTNATHVYMRLSDQPLLDDLTLFLPEQPSLIVKDPRKHMGIHCRFGVKRTIVDAHFDTARNMVAQVVGMRRWFLLPPKHCANTYLMRERLPSERHSKFDWGRPLDLDTYPKFRQAAGSEVIVTQGDVLYVPTYWLHYLVTLSDMSYQCNTRSGGSTVGLGEVVGCGFVGDTAGLGGPPVAQTSRKKRRF